MKYRTIIEIDDIKDFKFFEDGNGKYIVGKDAGAENDEWIALYFTECEQEPKTDVLDKIKAEILIRDKNVRDVRTDGRCFFTADEILGIIDKYRNEVSEE